MTYLKPACKGINCGATDGVSHSRECQAEHEATMLGAFQAAAELRRLQAEVEALRKDAERLDFFEDKTKTGCALSLVFDDNGHWAVSDAGMGPCVEGDGYTEPVGITAFVEPDQWRDSVRAAIDAAKEKP